MQQLLLQGRSNCHGVTALRVGSPKEKARRAKNSNSNSNNSNNNSNCDART